MEIVINFMFLSVSLMVFMAYRQGIKDSFYINNNLPIEKKDEKFADNELNMEYSKMMNYEFEMAGEDNDK